MKQKIRFYEELAMNAYPALYTKHYDGWIMLYSNGYVNRVNSVNPIYESVLPLEEKIVECQHTYESFGLPSVFKITAAAPGQLDFLLEQKGYEVVTPTYMMAKSLKYWSSDLSVRQTAVAAQIDEEWSRSYFRMNGIHESARQESILKIQENIKNPLICARIEHQGRIIACGLGILERGYMGIFGITVDQEFRGYGYGYDLCSSLLTAGKEMGAHYAYLQVVEANLPARKLYKKLNFTMLYQYWYRRLG